MEHLEQMVRNYTCVKVGLTMTFNGRPYWSGNGLPDWIADNIPQMPLCEPVHLEGEDIELVLTHYDGMHIRMLLVTFFLKSYIELIKAGHLYILKTTLFRVKTKKRNRYCYSQEERDAAVAEFSKEKVEITRFKGLGEINEEEFRDFIGKDMSRVSITIDKAEDVQMLLSFYMGVNTFERQKFIMRNLRSQTEIEGIDEDETWLA